MSSESPHKEKLAEATVLRETSEAGASDGSESHAFPNLGDNYDVLECIGQGGMGSVYKVRERASGQLFAIKVLQAKLTEDAAALKRFQQEAESASQLAHSNLVAVYGHGTTPDGAPYIVMDYLDGSGLSDVLKKDHHLDPKRALNIFIQICDALKHAHESGVVHRDVKPTNIILTRTAGGDEVAHIVDFGIAKAMPTANRETHDLTQTGEIFGSPHYMSPEQCLGFMLDHRSDVYSLGCLMYEVLTGGTPFEGANPIQVVVKHINEDPPGFPTAVKGDKLLDKLESVVLHCLEKDKMERYQSVDLVLKDLLAIKAGKQPEKYVRSVKPKATFTQKQTLGFLVACFAAVMYVCVVTGIVNSSAIGHIFGGFLTFLCSSGMYVFYSAARDEYRKNKSAGISERKAWLIVLLTMLGTCCLTALPASLFFLLGWQPSGSASYEGFITITVLGHFLCAALTAIVLICFTIFRSAAKARATRMALKYLATGMAIASLLYFGVPQQTERITLSLGQMAERTFPDVAKNLYELSSLLDTKNSEPFRRLAFMYRGHEDDGRELFYWTLAAEREPTTEALERMAQLYIKKGQLKEALAKFTQIIKDNPQDSYVYKNRGELFFKMGNYAQALKDLAMFNSKQQPTAESHILAAQSSAALGNFAQAALDLNIAYDSAYGNKTRILLMRAILNDHRGLHDLARRDYEAVAHTGTDWSELHYRAYAEFKLGHMQEFQEKRNEMDRFQISKKQISDDIDLGPLIKVVFPG